MTDYVANQLQTVQTYQQSGLALLQNSNCFVDTFNTKFKNFQSLTGNLGSSVGLSLPYKMNGSHSLTVAWQSLEQRLSNMTVDQAYSVPYTVSNPDEIFNLDKDGAMDDITDGAMAQFGAVVEGNLALNAISGVPVYDQNSVPTGALHTESGPYLFFGNGTTPINSYQQLAQMMADYLATGAPRDSEYNVYLPNDIVPAIIGTGLNQFVPRRNEDTAQSWELGTFGTPRTNYYSSNMLPRFEAGTLGNDATVLTVVNTNDPTGKKITQITFSNAGTDSDAIRSGDLAQFLDNVTNFRNLRWMTEYGQVETTQPVQLRMTANAASSGNNVTVTFEPALCSIAGDKNQNINQNIVAGMQLKLMPNHRAGLMVAGKAGYLGMPKLPMRTPFPTESKYDPATGVAMRLYYGSIMGTPFDGFVFDGIWTSLVIPRYSKRILFPDS